MSSSCTSCTEPFSKLPCKVQRCWRQHRALAIVRRLQKAATLPSNGTSLASRWMQHAQRHPHAVLAVQSAIRGALGRKAALRARQVKASEHDRKVALAWKKHRAQMRATAGLQQELLDCQAAISAEEARCADICRVRCVQRNGLITKNRTHLIRTCCLGQVMLLSHNARTGRQAVLRLVCCYCNAR